MSEEKTGHRQRLREGFLAGRIQAQDEVALLELLLSYAIPKADIQPLAEVLIREFGSLDKVLAADFQSLCQVKGLKGYTATLIKLADRIRVQCPQTSTQPHRQKPGQPPLFEEAEVPGIPASLISPASQPLKSSSRSLAKSPIPTILLATKPIPSAPKRKPPARPRTGLFGKAILKEAIEFLPQLPETESLEEIRPFLEKNLPFNAIQTRVRYANYILQRMFPTGIADSPLRQFARHFAGTQELRDTCFYRFCIAEPLLPTVIEELLLPAIGYGHLSRFQLRDLLYRRFPQSKSINDCARAMVEALVSAGIVKADKQKLYFGYRDIRLASFAFVLASEFPEPGMYDLAKLEQNGALRAMLWKPDQVLPTLYELRNQGLVDKVSEIDTVRQFTLPFTLSQMVEKLVKA
ncbi:MAG: DNA repair protein [Coprothermobacterota bacterium]|nr:DNA repair protein [Coprothermobacterota bacterium]